MKKLSMQPISFDISKLKPAISEIGFDMHYNKVYKKYVDDFNDGIGDFAFNKAGAHLNSLYFENIGYARPNNIPTGKAAQVIENRYGSWENFLKTATEQVSRLQGSGWIFMNHSGYINIIPNNRIVDNVAMIICFWEHSYCFTHGVDKMNWLKHSFNIIDWDVVNRRLVEKNDN